MAEFVVAEGKAFTTYDVDTEQYSGNGSISAGEPWTFTDQTPTDLVFQPGENIKVFIGATEFDAVYIGLTDFISLKFAVFQIGGEYYVMEANLSSSSQPDIDSLDIVEVAAACFMPGTKIATPAGETKIETLKIGDLIQTAAGRTVPVKWIGRQTVTRVFASQTFQLVKISKGALGHGVPYADLTVTADHGMIVDGYVINAAALVNDDTIAFVPLAELEDRITVYHIETDAHDEILANGAVAETFVDAISRKAFDNHQEYLDLYGAERMIPEMPQPRITSARLLPEYLKTRLGLRLHNQTDQAEVA